MIYSNKMSYKYTCKRSLKSSNADGKQKDEKT